LIIGGAFTSYSSGTSSSTTTNRITRLNVDGTLDTTFVSGSSQGVNNTVNAVAVDPVTGKILLGGSFTAHQSSGNPSINRIARFNTDGTLDTSFAVGTGFSSTVNAIGMDAAGNALIGGAFTSYNGTSVNRLVRLTPTGAIDASFNNAGVGSGFTAAPSVTLSVEAGPARRRRPSSTRPRDR